MDINTLLNREPDLVCYYNFKSLVRQSTINAFSVKLFSVNDTTILKPPTDTLIGPYDIWWMTGNVNYYVNDKKEVVGRLATNILSFSFGSIVFEDSRLDLVNVYLDNNLDEDYSRFKPNSKVISRITSGNKDFVNSTGFVVVTTDETDIRKVEVFFDKK